MSAVLLSEVPRTRPHLTKRHGCWVVLIRPGAAQVFAAMRWADWKNGRHSWYYNTPQGEPTNYRTRAKSAGCR